MSYFLPLNKLIRVDDFTGKVFIGIIIVIVGGSFFAYQQNSVSNKTEAAHVVRKGDFSYF